MTNKHDELTVAEAIVSVLPDGSVARVCSDDRDCIRFAVRAEGLKLRSVILRRDSLKKLQMDAASAIKIEYLQRDLMRNAERRAEFRYPRTIRHAAAVRKATIVRKLGMAIASAL
ncbi:MAG: hypothetical protein ACXVH7_05275 [Thermoanaerobaculia bacterium]